MNWLRLRKLSPGPCPITWKLRTRIFLVLLSRRHGATQQCRGDAGCGSARCVSHLGRCPFLTRACDRGHTVPACLPQGLSLPAAALGSCHPASWLLATPGLSSTVALAEGAPRQPPAALQHPRPRPGRSLQLQGNGTLLPTAAVPAGRAVADTDGCSRAYTRQVHRNAGWQTERSTPPPPKSLCRVGGPVSTARQEPTSHFHNCSEDPTLKTFLVMKQATLRTSPACEGKWGRGSPTLSAELLAACTTPAQSAQLPSHRFLASDLIFENGIFPEKQNY